jgi:hypothetical protein
MQKSKFAQRCELKRFRHELEITQSNLQRRRASRSDRSFRPKPKPNLERNVKFRYWQRSKPHRPEHRSGFVGPRSPD